MNLAGRGIDGQSAYGDSFHSDRHPHFQADESRGGNPESRSSASMTLVRGSDVTLSPMQLFLLKLCRPLQ